MGYSLQIKGYKLWYIELKKIMMSRYVTFQEVYSIDVTHTQLPNTPIELEPVDYSWVNDKTGDKQQSNDQPNDANNLPETISLNYKRIHADLPPVNSQ